MTDAMRTFRKYLDTHDKLVSEVRPVTLDPGTDRFDDFEVWMQIAGFASDALGVLTLTDDELIPHLSDLRRVIEALDRRISLLGG